MVLAVSRISYINVNQEKGSGVDFPNGNGQGKGNGKGTEWERRELPAQLNFQSVERDWGTCKGTGPGSGKGTGKGAGPGLGTLRERERVRDRAQDTGSGRPQPPVGTRSAVGESVMGLPG